MEKHILPSTILKNLLFLFLSFNFLSSLGGQSGPSIDFTNIRKEEGLSNNTVNKTIKDDLGFLWIATNEGLNRYDGANSMTVFKVDTLENSNSLASNIIRTLFSDSRGNLWIGTTHGGLTRYNSYLNEWKTFRHQTSDNSSISNDDILCIYEDRQQRLWIGTEDGLNLFNDKEETFINIVSNDSDPYSLETKAVLTVMEDHQGWLWVGTWEGGLHLLLEDNSDSIKFLNIKPSKTKQSHNIWKIYQDRENRYWVGTFGRGLFLMQLPPKASNKVGQTNWTPTFHNYMEEDDSHSISNDAISDILQDRLGRLWVGTTFGLNYIDAENLPDTTSINYSSDKKPALFFNRFYSNAEDESFICNSNILSILEDDEEIIWIGTANGLSQYTLYASQFKFFRLYNDSYVIHNSRNIYVDTNQVVFLAAGDDGLFNYDIKNRTFQSFSEKHPDFFLDKNIIALYGTPDDVLYVASSLGFSVINLKDNSSKKYPTPDWLREINSTLYIQSLYIDKQKNIWFGTAKGLYFIDTTTGIYSTMYQHDRVKINSLSDNSITAIIEDKNGNLWIGTFDGLNRIKRLPSGELEIKRFFFDMANPQKSLSSDQIVALNIIDDRLYIGTTAGLCSYDLEKEQFEVYGSSNQRMWIQSLVHTSDGDIWASSLEGIFHLDPKTKIIRSFEKNDGIKDPFFSLGSNTKDALGNIYFGSALGFTQFNPNQIKKNEKKPLVYITSLNIINPEGETKINSLNLKELELEHNDYYLAINFAGLNYIQPEKNLFAYQLLGFDDKWHYLKNNNTITFTNLEPKEYTLKVKAANNDGVWNEEGAVLHITKKPAFRQTWTFLLLSLFALVGLIFSGLQIYTNTQRKNIELAQMNEEISLAKLQSLTINMNPHFLFNAFNTLQNFILKNEKRNANQYLSNLSDIIRKLLNNSERISIPLLEEIEILNAYVNLEKERFVDAIDFKLIVEPKLLEKNPIIPSMIIQPHLENAILHGLSDSNQHGKITLVLSEKEEGNLHCIIRDNGIGRIKAREKRKQNKHLFMASQNTNDRIDILRKMGYQNAGLDIIDLYTEQNLPKGTEIIITLPLLGF